MDKFTASANMALFLIEKTGSTMGKWNGRMTAKAQRELFGQYLGKGTLVIDGATERLAHWVSVCFGQDYDYTFDKNWSAL